MLLPAWRTRMRPVGLLCTGLGRVRRGYESFAADLHAQLGGSVPMTLFKGGGDRADDEVVVANLPRDVSLALRLTADWGRAYRWEQLTFAAGLVPHLLGADCSVLHYMDLGLTGPLVRLRRWLGLDVPMLFKNGGAHTPEHYQRADFIQVLTPGQYREARDFGLPAWRLFELPLGLDAEAFRRPPGWDRDRARAALGVPADAPVVLAVAALSVAQKRADAAVAMVAALPAELGAWLVMAGEPAPDTPALYAIAAKALPGRHVMVTVPYRRVRELYWMADVLLTASLREGFGRAVIEAAAAGLPVVAHDDAHFAWLLGHPRSRADMRSVSVASGRVAEFLGDPALRTEVAEANADRARRGFDWNALRGRYQAMYEAIAGARG